MLTAWIGGRVGAVAVLASTFCTVSALADTVDCEPLEPNTGVDRRVEDHLSANASVLMKKLGSGEINNEYLRVEKYVLDKVPNADQLHIWNSTIYMLCTMLTASDLSDREKLDEFRWLVTTWRKGPPTTRSVGAIEEGECGVAHNGIVFSTLGIGDACPQLGTGNVIKVNRTNQRKALTSARGEPIAVDLTGFLVEGPYTLAVELSAAGGGPVSMKAWDAVGQVATITIHGHHVVFNGIKVSSKIALNSLKYVNEFRLVAAKDHLRFYGSKAFVGRDDILTNGLRRVLIEGLTGRDYLYAVSVQPGQD